MSGKRSKAPARPSGRAAREPRAAEVLDLPAIVAALPVPTAIFAADPPRFTLLALSDALAVAGGHPRDRLLGLPLNEAISEPGASLLRTALRHAIRTGAPQPVLRDDDPLRPPDRARESDEEALVTPIPDAGGDIRWVLYHAVEGAAHVVTDAALLASEGRTPSMVNIPGVGMLIFDERGTLVGSNDAFLQMTGYTRQQVEGRALSWKSMTPPEYVAVSEEQLRLLAATGRIGPYEKEYLRADGSRSWMLFSGATMGDGTVVEVCVDVSDRHRVDVALRESEARLAADLAGMRRLYDLHARLATETDLKTALDEILAAACEFTGTDRGCVQLVSEDGERLEIFAHRGYDDATSPFINHFRFEGFAEGCDLARVERRRVIIEETVGYPGLEGTEAGAAVLADGIRAAQSTPMVSREGGTVGVLSTQFTMPHRPSEDELRLIDLLAWAAADFVERHHANHLRRLAERTAERDELRRQLTAAEEAERRRLARELHDQLGQQLTAFTLGLEDAERLATASGAAAGSLEPLLRRLDQLKALARELAAGARSIALELRPPELDDAGLESAMETYVAEWAARYRVAVELEVAGVDGERPLAPETGTALYRILQEALNNIAKHAGASHVSVILERYDGTIRLVVEDNGEGFDVEAATSRAKAERRLGLAGVQERAALVGGSVSVESTPGSGTALYVRVPLAGPASVASRDVPGR